MTGIVRENLSAVRIGERQRRIIRRSNTGCFSTGIVEKVRKECPEKRKLLIKEHLRERLACAESQKTRGGSGKELNT